MDPAFAVLPQIELVKVSMGIPAAIGVSIGLAAGTINANGTRRAAQALGAAT